MSDSSSDYGLDDDTEDSFDLPTKIKGVSSKPIVHAKIAPKEAPLKAIMKDNDDADNDSSYSSLGQLSANDDESVIGDWLEEVEDDILEDSKVGETNSKVEDVPPLDPNIMEFKALYDAIICVSDLRFTCLTTTEQAELLATLIEESYEPGEIIFEKDNMDGEVYFIVGPPDAQVEVTKIVDDEPKLLTRLGFAQYFGHRTFISNRPMPRNISVKAVTHVNVAILTPEHFAKWSHFRTFLLMKEVPMFRTLPHEEQVHMYSQLQHQDFADGEYIVRQGDVGDKFYMITDGAVDIVEECVLESGARTNEVLTRLYEGHFFGEMALIYDEPRVASVVAVGRTSCLYLTTADFRQALSAQQFHIMMQEISYKRVLMREQRKITREMTVAKKVEETEDKVSESSEEDSLGRSLVSSNDSESLSSSGSNKVTTTNKLVRSRLSTGDRLINKYLVIKEIGRGTSGDVYLCKNEETGYLSAMKIITRPTNRWSQSAASEIEKEINIMKSLRHPHIVSLLEVIDDPSVKQVFLIQEYMQGGPILPGDVVTEPIPPDHARAYFRDMLSGVKYLHSQGIVHRDIKPQNMLRTADNVVKIADFGAAVFTGSTKNESALGAGGTPAFMAPEMFLVGTPGQDKDIANSPKVDVWSLGITLFNMIAGRPPFWAANQLELAAKIQNVAISYPEELLSMDPHLRHLISRMLDKDWKTRIDLDQVIEHDWVTNEGSDPLEDPFLISRDADYTYLTGDSRSGFSDDSPVFSPRDGLSSMIYKSFSNKKDSRSDMSEDKIQLSLKNTGAVESDRGLKSQIVLIPVAKGEKSAPAGPPTLIPVTDDLSEESSNKRHNFLNRKSNFMMMPSEMVLAPSGEKVKKSVIFTAPKVESKAVEDSKRKMSKRMSFNKTLSRLKPKGAGSFMSNAGSFLSLHDDISMSSLNSSRGDSSEEKTKGVSADKLLDLKGPKKSNRSMMSLLHPLQEDSLNSSGCPDNDMISSETHRDKKRNVVNRLDSFSVYSVQSNLTEDEDDNYPGIKRVSSQGDIDLLPLIDDDDGGDDDEAEVLEDLSEEESDSESDSSADVVGFDLAEAQTLDDKGVTDVLDELCALPTDKYKGADPQITPLATNVSIDLQTLKTWAGQLNLTLGIRYGVAESIVDRDYMEDRTWAAASSLEHQIRNKRHSLARKDSMTRKESASSLTAAASAPDAESEPIGNEPEQLAPNFAFFGVFDGHNGFYVAEALKANLYQLFREEWELMNTKVLKENLSEAESAVLPDIMDTALTSRAVKCIVSACAKIDRAILGCDFEKQKLLQAERREKIDEKNKTSHFKETFSFAGSTAVVMILFQDTQSSRTQTTASDLGTSPQTAWDSQSQSRSTVWMVLANVGDCRAVLCDAGAAICLTNPHKPSLPSEKTRIEKAGGWVHRNRVNGVLAVSRSFGDIMYKTFPPPEPSLPAAPSASADGRQTADDFSDSDDSLMPLDDLEMTRRERPTAQTSPVVVPWSEGGGLWGPEQHVISKPEVVELEVKPSFEFVVMASDGLWDVLTPDEVINFVRRRLHEHHDCQRAAIETVTKAEARGTSDNTSVVICALNQRERTDIPRTGSAFSMLSTTSTSNQEVDRRVAAALDDDDDDIVEDLESL